MPDALKREFYHMDLVNENGCIGITLDTFLADAEARLTDMRPSIEISRMDNHPGKVLMVAWGSGFQER